MKKIFFVAFVLFSLNGVAQTEKESLRLMKMYPQFEIGDTIPLSLLESSLRPENASRPLPDLKNKLIILDYWSPGCSSCLEAMPKTDFLQKKFKEKVAIISVMSVEVINDSMKKAVHNFWNNNKYTKTTSQPWVLDTILYKRLVHDGAPFLVWIDTNMVVRAFTWTDRLNEKELSAFRSGQELDWRSVNWMPFDISIPFRKQFLMRDKILNRSQHSMTTRYVTSVMAGSVFDTTGSELRFATVNKPIPTLYSLATGFTRRNGNPINVKYDSVTLESKHGRNTDTYRDDWIKQHLFCYELYIPRHLSNDQQLQFIIDDLNKSFNLNAAIKPELTTCVILKEITPVVTAYNAQYVRNDLSANDELVKIKSTEELVTRLRSELQLCAPLFSTLTTKKQLNVSILWSELNLCNGSLEENITRINKKLAKYGYKLETEQRMYPVLYIK